MRRITVSELLSHIDNDSIGAKLNESVSFFRPVRLSPPHRTCKEIRDEETTKVQRSDSFCAALVVSVHSSPLHPSLPTGIPQYGPQ